MLLTFYEPSCSLSTMSTHFGPGGPISPWRMVPCDMLAYLSKIEGVEHCDVLICVAIVLGYPDRFPSSRKLAALSGVHYKTIQKHLISLRKSGIVGGNAKKRVGAGFIQEVNLFPFWDRLRRYRELTKAVVVDGVEDEPAVDPEMSDEDIRKLGPADATIEQAQVMRQVLNTQGKANAWAEAEAAEQAEVMELEMATDVDVEAALQLLPVTTFDNLLMKKTSKEAPPALALLPYEGLDPRVIEGLRERTFDRSIGICWPLWGEPDALQKFDEFLRESYAKPASSHDEVWLRADELFRVYLRARSREFDLTEDRARFEIAFDAHAAAQGDKALDLDEFRRRYYCNGEFRQ